MHEKTSNDTCNELFQLARELSKYNDEPNAHYQLGFLQGVIQWLALTPQVQNQLEDHIQSFNL